MLKPFDITSVDMIPDELHDILVDSGLAPKKEETLKDTARAKFDHYGASIDSIAATVSSVMSNGETDAGRLKAAELALKVQGILDEKVDKTPPIVTINILGRESKSLINLIMPRTVGAL